LSLLNGNVLSLEHCLPQSLIEDVNSLQQLLASLVLASQIWVLLTESVEVVTELGHALLVRCLTADEVDEVGLRLREKREDSLTLSN